MKIYITSIFLMFAFVFITGLKECMAQNINNEEHDMDNEMKEAALVCNLSDSELIERAQLLREEIFKPDKVSDIIELEDGYKYIYNQPVDFSLELIEFINFERKCCPAFKFTLEFEPEEGPISLKIYGSEQIREMLSAMIKNSKLHEPFFVDVQVS